MRIVLISDTHGLHRRVKIPDGDLLVHAGDLTNHGELEQVEDFNAWLGGLPHAHKIVIAGNHDFCFEKPDRASRLLTNATYLLDSETRAGGLRIWGSPWQPWFFDWAFNLERGPEIRAKWKLIPAGIDILVTHGPPAGFGDKTVGGDFAGCTDLLDELRARVRPRLHVFGHIHEGYGIFRDGSTTLVNASTCDIQYRAVNPPVVIDL